jgi:hypothetical protein
MFFNLVDRRLIFASDDLESLLDLVIVSSDACNDQIDEAEAVVNALNSLLACWIEFLLIGPY